MIRLAALGAIALLAGSGLTQSNYGDDLTLLQQQLPQIHPHVDVQAFDARVATFANKLPTLTEDQADVGFMKLVASLGPRNGHTGIFPLDHGNQRSFHEYPLLPYEFPDGLVVVGQVGASDLVGARIESIGGVPAAEVLARVGPLVPRDNHASIRAHRAQFVMCAEVLHGLGITPDTGPLSFDLVLANGQHVSRTLAPVSAAAYASGFPAFRMFPAGAAHAPDRAARVRRSLLAGGRVVYLVYNDTQVYMDGYARQLLRLGTKPGVRRIVVDLRNNSGGDNTTYPVLIDALNRLAAKQHKEVVVIAGRVTFSAAVNFLGHLEKSQRFLLVGEDSGGAPNLYGDATPLDLPETGLRVDVATIWWVKSKLGERDPRITFRPDVAVRTTAAQWLAGKDPVLRAAISAPFAKARAVH